MSEYEKQRLLRIRDNKERLEALGLPSLVSSLNDTFSSTKINAVKNKGKKKKREEDDDDYKPSSDEEDTLNHDDDDDDDDEQFVDDSSSFEQKGKKKSTPNATTNKKRSPIKRSLEDSNEDDTNLEQAIALSLGTILADKFEPDVDECEEKDKAKMQGTTGRNKSAHMNKSRVQLTEDEVVAYFFSFDETGKGYISYHDLKRMVHAHDFNWSEKEIASMIQTFDRYKDGKLRLEDFRSIVCRCNMMLEA